jgi:hypothetical protein
MGAECTKVEELCHGEHEVLATKNTKNHKVFFVIFVSFVADTLCPLWLMLVFLSESTK